MNRFYVEAKPGVLYGAPDVKVWFLVIDRVTGQMVPFDGFTKQDVAERQAEIYNSGVWPTDYQPERKP